jgi:hypothetical protein
MASIALFVACILLVSAISTANAQEAVVYIGLSDTIPNIGDTFTAKVNVSDVTGLYGWELKLYYPRSIINYTSYSLVGGFIESGGSTFPIDKTNRNYNATHGLFWLADSLLGAPAGVSGSGTLVTLTFNALADGSAALTFEDLSQSQSGVNIKLGDQAAQPIPNTAISSELTVIPEFTALLLLIAAMITSAVAISAKRFSKVHKSIH